MGAPQLRTPKPPLDMGAPQLRTPKPPLEHELAPRSDGPRPPGWDHRRRPHLLDDGGAAHAGAARQALALMDIHVEHLAAEGDAARPSPCRRRRPRRGPAWQRRLRHAADAGDAEVDDLGLAVAGVTVPPLVRLVERTLQAVNRRGAGGPAHGKLPRLTHVAHAERPREGDAIVSDPRGDEVRACLALELGEDRLDLRERGVARGREPGADVVPAQVGDQRSERGEVAGRRGDDDARHLELLRDEDGVQRAGAAVRDQ